MESLLVGLGAAYKHGRPYHPQAQGKVWRTPAEAYGAREKARPKAPVLPAGHYRLRRDRLDKAGKVSVRYQSRLRHIGVGRAYASQRVLLLIAERDVRVLTEHGELLGTCTIDPAKGYQALSKPVVSGMS
jgi:hypothetical protein